MEIKLGKYKHFKGGEYEVLGVAKHSETQEEFVLYKHITEDNSQDFWVRPVQMFFEEVEKDGVKVPRFKYIE